eukprot:5759998-Pyramimonas_sp.AAC.1
MARQGPESAPRCPQASPRWPREGPHRQPQHCQTEPQRARQRPQNKDAPQMLLDGSSGRHKNFKVAPGPADSRLPA